MTQINEISLGKVPSLFSTCSRESNHLDAACAALVAEIHKKPQPLLDGCGDFFGLHIGFPESFLSSISKEGKSYSATSRDPWQGALQPTRAKPDHQRVDNDERNAKFGRTKTRKTDLEFLCRRQHQERVEHEGAEHAQHEHHVEDDPLWQQERVTNQNRAQK